MSTKYGLAQAKIPDARRQEVSALIAISVSLDCSLDVNQMYAALGLLEQGVHPEAIADMILEARANKQRAGGS